MLTRAARAAARAQSSRTARAVERANKRKRAASSLSAKRGKAAAKTTARKAGRKKAKKAVPAGKQKRETKVKAYPGLTPADYVPKAPPKADWLKTFELVRELRQDRTAPVDTFGSEALPQRPPKVTKEVFRFQALVALMLSSQTKDPVVGAAIKRLQSGLGPHGLSLAGVRAASEDRVRELIYGVGFYNNKAKYIKRSADLIAEKFAGRVPSDYTGLVSLPGVGPKMALIILDVAFNQCLGVSIDTHLHRMLGQLGWTKNAKNPDDTRKQLESWLPREYWPGMNLVWVGLGQEVREDREKLLKKAVACSDPPAAIRLLRRLGVDVQKEAEKADIALP